MNITEVELVRREKEVEELLVEVADEDPHILKEMKN